jgi:hypothetical protein
MKRIDRHKKNAALTLAKIRSIAPPLHYRTGVGLFYVVRMGLLSW